MKNSAWQHNVLDDIYPNLTSTNSSHPVRDYQVWLNSVHCLLRYNGNKRFIIQTDRQTEFLKQLKSCSGHSKTCKCIKNLKLNSSRFQYLLFMHIKESKEWICVIRIALILLTSFWHKSGLSNIFVSRGALQLCQTMQNAIIFTIGIMQHY